MADCLAGVWAHHAHRSRQLLEPGDVEEGLRAAACELVLEALVAQRRITRKSGGYMRVPHEGPTPGKGYKGFDPMGGLEI